MRKGIQFMVDEAGERTAVVIDLREHADLWEDFFDSMLAAERESEPRSSLEEVKRRLAEQDKLGAA